MWRFEEKILGVAKGVLVWWEILHLFDILSEFDLFA